MSFTRRDFLTSLALTGSALLVGCATRPAQRSVYNETISSVLLSEDGKQLVVAGREHHYVFDAPSAIAKTISSEFHGHVSGSLADFTVKSGGYATGLVTLVLGPGASAEDRKAALAAGYVLDSAGRVVAERKLTGVRYAADKSLNMEAASDLNRTYHVRVVDQQPRHESPPATPVHSGANGFLVIAAVPLIVVGALLMGLACTGDRCK